MIRSFENSYGLGFVGNKYKKKTLYSMDYGTLYLMVELPATHNYIIRRMKT